MTKRNRVRENNSSLRIELKIMKKAYKTRKGLIKTRQKNETIPDHKYVYAQKDLKLIVAFFDSIYNI